MDLDLGLCAIRAVMLAWGQYMSSVIHVFFFRGMSTHGNDNATWAGLDFGPMYRRWQSEMSRRGAHFHSIQGMGAGRLTEMAARARQFLRSHPVWRNPDQPVHFLGHSAGGLITRLILQHGDVARGKVLSSLSIATPHSGAALADLCINMSRTHPGSYRAMRLGGFNLNKHAEFFAQFTGANLQRLFNDKPIQPAAERVASIVCASPRAEWCRILKLFYKLKAFHEFDVYSDGMIERDTQPFGEVFAELRIDHFRQIGLFDDGRLFRQMCDVMYDFFVTTQRR
jgi:hypothetical protein